MRKFLEVFDDITRLGKKIPKEDYLEEGLYPIVDQGQELIAGYTNDKEGLFEDVPAIIFGDHTRILKYINYPLFLGADGVKLLKPKDDKQNCKYLYYALKNVRIPDTGYNRHFKWLKEAEIKVYDLDTQNRIVKVFDLLESLIYKHNEQLQKLDLLIKSEFVEMFGNPITNSHQLPLEKLSDLGLLERGRSKHRPRNAPELLNGPYPLIQTGDVSAANLYITDYKETYSEIGLKQSKMWKSGTLCITIAANIAQTAILSFDACFPDSVVGFIPNGKIKSVYLHYWFYFLQKILDMQAPQVAQKNINLKILSDLKVTVPSLEEQNQFATFVQQVDKSRLAVQQSLEQLEILKKSLMQEYFG